MPTCAFLICTAVVLTVLPALGGGGAAGRIEQSLGRALRQDRGQPSRAYLRADLSFWAGARLASGDGGGNRSPAAFAQLRVLR